MPETTPARYSVAACPLCGTSGNAVRPITDWAWHCHACGVRFSSLEPRIEEGTAVEIDEDSREIGLRVLRERGYGLVLDAVARRRSLSGLRVLDIGSGHGWFLESAAARGMEAVGVEPDRAVAERALARGLDVRVGFFPDDLPAAETFDLVVFNDVPEHLPDLPGVLASVRARLRPEGMTAISIPTADGLAYRIATGLKKVGVTTPFDRLWQRDYPSPHLWYFTEPSLVRTVSQAGFAPVSSGRLPSIERAGLRERIAADPRSGLVTRASFMAASAAAPVLNHARFSDAMWVLFRPAD